MKIEDSFTIVKHHYAPSGTPIERYHISDVPLDRIVTELNSSGVMVYSNLSSKQVRFSGSEGAFKGSIKSIVPLYTIFPESVSVTLERINLHDGKGLEIILRDFEHVTVRPEEGVMGGPYGGQFGIMCEVRIESYNPQVEEVSAIRKIIQDLYRKSDKVIAIQDGNLG